MAVQLSLVMPVLNEAGALGAQLARLQSYRQRGHELVVVDGGSTDGSGALAETHVDRLLDSEPGRALQMNRGAAAAGGDILVFLHADTQLPEAADELIIAALHGERADWGWFDARLSHPGPAYQLIGHAMSWRARLTRVCTGDQTLFVRRSLFQAIGGFPPLPLMEDVAISKRLRRRARSACVRQPVVTSSRRWQQQGILSTLLFMWKLRWLYFIGIDTERLARQYYPERLS